MGNGCRRKNLTVQSTIGPPYRYEGHSFVWGKIIIEYTQGRYLQDSTIEVRVPIRYAEEMTVRQIQEASATAAKDLIMAVASDLAEADAAEMLRLSSEFGDLQEDELTLP